MVKRYIQILGLDGTKDLLIANEKPLVPSIRLNNLKKPTHELLILLKSRGYELTPINNVPYGFKVLRSPTNLGSSHEFLQGYYYIQNYASMLPALILNPQPSIVVDMCAAPGSKATQLAQIMNNSGILYLFDRNRRRIPALKSNIDRLGVLNTIIINSDSRNINKLRIEADHILLDAPCTGEGLIRQDPSRKTSKSLNDIKKMSKIQKGLLESGLTALKPGGKLVYSTCSIAPEENEIVIDEIIRDQSDYSIMKIPIQFGVKGLTEFNGESLLDDLCFAQRLYPHLHDTIGFFICLIEKK